jgi:hypothetical protein
MLNKFQKIRKNKGDQYVINTHRNMSQPSELQNTEVFLDCPQKIDIMTGSYRAIKQKNLELIPECVMKTESSHTQVTRKLQNNLRCSTVESRKSLSNTFDKVLSLGSNKIMKKTLTKNVLDEETEMVVRNFEIQITPNRMQDQAIGPESLRITQ